MDVTAYENLVKLQEEYHRVKVSKMTFSDTELDVPGVGQFVLNEDVFNTLCKFVGIPKGLNRNLLSLDRTLWEKVVKELYNKYSLGEIVIKLVDGQLAGITNYEKDPVSNERFVNRCISYFEDVVGVDIDDIRYASKHQLASVSVLSTKDHVNGTDTYRLGVVLENDSLYGVNVRLVVKNVTKAHYVYGIPSAFNLSSARYNRTTDNGFEALNAMLVTLADALRGDVFTQLFDKLDTVIYKENNVRITYEEFHRTRQVIQRALNVSQFDEDSVNKIVDDFRTKFDFYQNYTSVMEADPIWRQTAFSDRTVVVAREFLSDLANNISLTYEAQRDLKWLAGELMFGKSLYQSIAIRK